MASGLAAKICFRKESAAFLRDSISEGLKRFEAEDGVSFGLGKGFEGSGDVVLLEDFFKSCTAKSFLKLRDSRAALTPWPPWSARYISVGDDKPVVPRPASMAASVRVSDIS